ncbi:MFS transporter [Actinomadura sp. NPDC047616]|uniref:MFS transporter n=1 Tax=Actinomadura sp. NPDC047616 TaxID=3155914 RepID=UPI0033DBB2A8
MDTSTTTGAEQEPRGGRWALTVLTLGAFTLGTGEIMIAGLLPDIAAAAGVRLSTAGLLVSVFAATVVLGGPVLALTTGTVGRRRLLAVFLALFVAGNAGAALTSSFAVLMGARVAAALAHSALMPLLVALAVDVVPEHRRGTAVARVSLGLSLAMIVGLPLGTAVGHRLSWRAAFCAVALLACAATWPLLRVAGRAAAPVPGGRTAELRVLGDRRVQSVVAVTVLSAAAAFTAYTYITPLLTDGVGFGTSTVTALLLLFGIGGTLGNLLGGRLADRSVTRAVCAGVAVLATALLALGASTASRPLAVIVLLVFGGAYYAVIPAVNTRMVAVASDRAWTLALTVQSSAFNLGIAVGGWLGGQVIAAGAALRWVPVTGGLVALLALAVALAEHHGRHRRIAPAQAVRAAEDRDAMREVTA